MSSVTCIAPVNIAVIKYWGKRDEQLILPLNDSVSVTLSIQEMHAKTTVMLDQTFDKDKMWLNGKEESVESPRLKTCLNEIRRRAAEKEKNPGHETRRSSWKVHICSENNFPTGAGLASSAAGYACLVTALGKVYQVEEEIELSKVARLGSGSACRSMLGGFVRWHKGLSKDGSDSVPSQIYPHTHWPSLRILILIVSDTKKKVSSTSGMQQSVETSELLKHRVSHIVPQRTEEIIKALKRHDFEEFGELTMKDSNQFHSVCLDTFPPAVYMNDVSHLIVDFVHAYNKLKGTTKLAYTFDAGPNACLFLEEEDAPEVLALIKQTFPPSTDNNYIRGANVPQLQVNRNMSEETVKNVNNLNSSDMEWHQVPNKRKNSSLAGETQKVKVLKENQVSTANRFSPLESLPSADNKPPPLYLKTSVNFHLLCQQLNSVIKGFSATVRRSGARSASVCHIDHSRRWAYATPRNRPTSLRPSGPSQVTYYQ